MKNSAFIIRIPEPCHQPWENMKPENSGRYCGSCEKVVVDFTNKTDQEIQALLRENASQKTCGHFRTSQINRPISVTLDVEAISRSGNPRRVFIAALLLVFGTSLISCYNHQNKKIHITQVKAHEPEMTLGEVQFEPDVSESAQMVEESKDMVTDYPAVLGEVEVSTDETTCERATDNDTARKPEADTTDSILSDTLAMECYTTGMMEPEYFQEISSPAIIQYSINEAMATQAGIDGDNNTTHAELIVYPNPGDGHFFVQYRVKDRCNVLLELIDLQGKTLMQIVDVKSQHTGEYHIPVDLSTFRPDVYLFRLYLGEKQAAARVVVRR